MTRTALLIVDVQKGFINEETENIPALVERLLSSDVYDLVCATRFVNYEDSPFVRWMGWNRFMEGSDDVELSFSTSSRVHVFDKKGYADSLSGLVQILERNRIEKIHICGIDTNMCVFAIASYFFDLGIYEPFVLSHYCASHSGKYFHESGLMLLKKAIGDDHVL